MARSVKVAVIGAGVSGLVAARELQREGHDVVVFEKNNRVGGIWVYHPKTYSDSLSKDPTRHTVHGGLYLSLRTNLPRQLMGFLDYPFAKRESGDPRTFPGHEEVLRFLEEFASEFGINGLTRFETEVVKVERMQNGENKWVVELRPTRVGDSVSREVFDAVVVCSVHLAEPNLGEIPGIETWRGLQMHSHNYRVPQPFEDQDHVFHVFELQSKWVARVLSGKVMLPSEEEMMKSVRILSIHGGKWVAQAPHPFHSSTSGVADYQHWLVREIGLPPLEVWRDRMYRVCVKNFIAMNENFRDEWDNNHWDAIIQSESASKL